MKIVQMKNDEGRAVANQFIIFTPEATYFQSYQTIIVKTTFEDGERVVYLDEDSWDYSRTTAKWRNRFLGKTTKEIKNNIKKGVYRLAELNN